MHSPTCVSVVVCVARKPRPCLSYSWRRDRINLVPLCSYYKGGGMVQEVAETLSEIWDLEVLCDCTDAGQPVCTGACLA